jgi:hypothetical protein
MEQAVRDIWDDHVGDRKSALVQIETAWAKQSRRQTAAEVDDWIAIDRP